MESQKKIITKTQTKILPNTLICNLFSRNKEQALINGKKSFKCAELTAGSYMLSLNGNFSVEFQLDGTIAVYVGIYFNYYYCHLKSE